MAILRRTVLSPGDPIPASLTPDVIITTREVHHPNDLPRHKLIVWWMGPTYGATGPR